MTLSTHQLAAIQRYTADPSGIRTWLATRGQVQSIIEALDQLPKIDEEIIVYRGLDTTDQLIAQWKQDSDLFAPDRILIRDTLTGTSSDIEQAELFAEGRRNDTGYGIILKFECKTGKDISTYSTSDHEKEVLFRPGLKLKVLSVVEKGEYKIVTCDEDGYREYLKL